MHALMLAALLCAAADEPPPSPEKASAAQEALAVLPVATTLNEPGVSDAAILLAGSLTARLAAFPDYRVIGADEVAELLRNEQDRQSVGCSDAACLAELAGALGARWVVTGELAKLGDAYVWTASLVDQHTTDVKQRAQARGRSFGALAAQVEEVAYTLLGRASEVSLDDAGARKRLGFVEKKDFEAFRTYRAQHAEMTTADALTRFIIEHNVESNALAIAQAVLFTASSLVPGIVVFLGLTGVGVTTYLNLAPLGALFVLAALLVLPVGPVLMGTAVTLAIVDALDRGRVRVRASGCCRDEEALEEAASASGLRRAAGIVVTMGTLFAFLSYFVALGPYSIISVVLPRLSSQFRLGARGDDPLVISVNTLGSMIYTAAFFAFPLVAGTSLVSGLLLLFWPDKGLVEGGAE